MVESRKSEGEADLGMEKEVASLKGGRNTIRNAFFHMKCIRGRACVELIYLGDNLHSFGH